MKDLGAAKNILGMEIKRARKGGKLYLTQKSYIEKVLERFGMKNAKLVLTPFAAGDLDKRRSLTGYVFTLGGKLHCSPWLRYQRQR